MVSFQSIIYFIQDNIDAARAAFDGFLPLYPYCFAYWRKISDMELKHGNAERLVINSVSFFSMYNFSISGFLLN